MDSWADLALIRFRQNYEHSNLNMVSMVANFTLMALWKINEKFSILKTLSPCTVFNYQYKVY